MSSIQPIATTRVTASITRSRLAAQIQQDQQELFRLQNQLSTGFRIFLPSDDASAAQRAIVLQRTLERRDQSVTNLQGVLNALNTSEASLANVGNQLNTIKSEALNVVGTFGSDDQREALIAEIDTLIADLVRVGNSSFTGSYLFGGSEFSAEPFDGGSVYVDYLGDETAPQTFVDIGFLFKSALPGDEVFGGLSEAVRGTVDLDPQPTPDTRLAQINGGLGVGSNGAVEITYRPASGSQPTETAVVDLSAADTLGDVARLIESGAPEGAQLTATVGGEGLVISSSSGDIGIAEVGEGRTASELGILQDDLLTSSITGAALDPTIRVTTSISDLGGTKARGLLTFGGVDNDLSIVATSNGADYNDLNVVIVDGAAVGGETAAYDGTVADGGTNTLTITIADGESTAEQIAAAINAAGVPFTAETDYRDATSSIQQGVGAVGVPSGPITNVTAGGSGDSIDIASGLRITNGAEEVVVDTSEVETVEDLLNLLNEPTLGLAASINAAGDGVDVRTRRSGANFAIGENGGSTAADLGIRTFTLDSRLADFNRGQGVVIEAAVAVEPGPDELDTTAQNAFTIELLDAGVSTTYDIDVTDAVTVGDFLAEISLQTAGAVTADLASVGNGIVLTRNDAVDPALEAHGTIAIAGDSGPGSFDIIADTPGVAGNRDFTIEFIDSGAGGLTTTVTDDAILVDYGGATPDTDQIASSIDGALTGYTVTSSFAPADTITTPPAGSQNFFAQGGFDADEMTVSGHAAERLGFLPDGEDSVTSLTTSITSSDRNPREVDSVFTTLLRMRDALERNDQQDFEAEINRLDDDLDRVTFGRSEIGARVRSLNNIETRLGQEEVELRTALSREIDADLVEVISDYTAQQAALQASLQTAGSLLNLSILDFI